MDKKQNLTPICARVRPEMRVLLEKMAFLEQRTLSNLVKIMLDEGIKRRIDAVGKKND